MLQSAAFLRIASLAALLVFWEALGRLFDFTALPPVSSVLDALLALVRDGSLVRAFAVSLQALGIGFATAVVVGIAVGLLVGYNDEADHLLAPYISALLALPSVAYIPVIIIWVGFDLTARSIVVFEFAVLVIIVTVRAGVRTVDHSLVEMGRSFGLTGWRLSAKVTLPAAMPAMFAGIRLGLGRAVKGTIVAEVLLTLVGLGGLVKYYGNTFQVSRLYAVVIAILAFALLLTEGLRALDRRVHAWKAGQE